MLNYTQNLLSWVGCGWLRILLRLRLSQPSLAGVGSWAELGNKLGLDLTGPISAQEMVRNEGWRTDFPMACRLGFPCYPQKPKHDVSL